MGDNSHFIVSGFHQTHTSWFWNVEDDILEEENGGGTANVS